MPTVILLAALVGSVMFLVNAVRSARGDADSSLVVRALKESGQLASGSLHREVGATA